MLFAFTLGVLYILRFQVVNGVALDLVVDSSRIPDVGKTIFHRPFNKIELKIKIVINKFSFLRHLILFSQLFLRLCRLFPTYINTLVFLENKLI